MSEKSLKNLKVFSTFLKKYEIVRLNENKKKTPKYKILFINVYLDGNHLFSIIMNTIHKRAVEGANRLQLNLISSVQIGERTPRAKGAQFEFLKTNSNLLIFYKK